jgi:NSS family neurotransmitter:Na+ symporter
LIFALGLQGEIIGADTGTLGALFVALPKAFATMGAAGRVVGTCFFFALVVGALTSAISLLEVVVSAAIDGFGWTRARAAWVMGGLAAVMGMPAALDIAVLDAMDTVANNLFLIGGGLGLAVFTGWVMEDPLGEMGVGADRPAWVRGWLMLLRYVVPVVLLGILAVSVEGTVAKVTGLFG